MTPDYTLLQAGLGLVLACAIVVIVYPLFVLVDALLELTANHVQRFGRGGTESDDVVGMT